MFRWLRKDPLSRVPIKYKLPLTFIFLCLLAFGVGGYLVVSSVYHTLEEEILTRLEKDSFAQATILENKFELLKERVEDFASDGFIRSAVESGLHSASGNQLLINHLRENKLPLEPTFKSILIEPSGGGMQLITGKPFTPSEPRTRVPQDSESTAISPVFTAGTPPGYFFAISSPLRDIQHRNITGRLTVLADLSILLQESLVYSSAVESRGEVGRYSLTISDGRNEYTWINPQPGNRHPLKRGVLSIREGSMTPLGDHQGRHTCRNGTSMYGQSYPMSSTGWTVIMESDASAAFATMTKLESRFLGTAIVVAIVITILLYFPLKFVIKPLDALTVMARKIRDGRYSERTDHESGDEIGELSLTFNHMAQAIEDRTTHLEKIAEELRIEHDRLNSVVQSMDDGLVLLDEAGEVSLANRAARPILAILNREGGQMDKRQCSSEEEAFLDCAQCLLHSRRSQTCVIRQGEKTFEVLTSWVPNSSGAQGKILVSRDITEREQMRERQSHQERLTVLGKMSAVVAHELNSPLAAISMYNQMMAGDLAEESPFHEHTEVIQRNTKSCQHIVRELLDYARTPAPEMGEVELRQLLTDVVRFLRPIYESRMVSISIEGSDQHVTVPGDAMQLQQVFINLIMNAIQAVPESEGKVEIVIRTGHILAIDIADNGSGVSDDIRSDIFEPFFTTKKAGGTGLGLPTASRIVRAHHGSLTLHQSDRGGSVFRVELPFESADEAKQPEESATEHIYNVA